MKLEKIVCGKWYYYVRFCDYSYDFKIRFKRVFKIECNSDGRSTIYFGLPGEYDKVTPDCIFNSAKEAICFIRNASRNSIRNILANCKTALEVLPKVEHDAQYDYYMITDR